MSRGVRSAKIQLAFAGVISRNRDALHNIALYKFRILFYSILIAKKTALMLTVCQLCARPVHGYSGTVRNNK